MKDQNLKLCKCGIQIPTKQDTCYGCWRELDRKNNPNHYRPNIRLFPSGGGLTRSTISWDKWRSTDKFNGGYVS